MGSQSPRPVRLSGCSPTTLTCSIPARLGCSPTTGRPPNRRLRIQDADRFGKLRGAPWAGDPDTLFKALTAGGKELVEVVRRLAEMHRPQRLYLFRSVAIGDAGPHSDYDIIVVIRDDAPLELRRSRSAYVALGALGLHPVRSVGLDRYSF